MMKILNQKETLFISGGTVEVADTTISTRCTNFIEDSLNSMLDLVNAGIFSPEIGGFIVTEMLFSPGSPCIGDEVNIGLTSLAIE